MQYIGLVSLFFSVYVFCPNGSSGEMHLNRKHLKSCFFFYCSGFRSDGFWMKIHLVEIHDDFHFVLKETTFTSFRIECGGRRHNLGTIP